MALADRVDGPTFSCGLQLSGDGGATWLRTKPVPRLPPNAERCYAPEIAFDAKGALNYLFLGLKGKGNNPIGAFLTTSRDNGKTFAKPRRLLGPGNYQVRMAIDRSRGSQGRMHLVWLRTVQEAPTGGLPPPPNPILSAYSDDGGKTLSQPVTVSDASRSLSVAPALALGPRGEVHVLYYDLGEDLRDYQGLDGPVWDGKWSLVATRSLNGGRSFAPGSVVNDQLVPNERVMLIYTMPSASLAVHSSTIYAGWSDSRNGDWDVLASRSTNKGGSWGRPVRINDDPIGSGLNQYLPRLSVAPNGRLDATFFDRRNDPQNIRNDAYYAFSNNGLTFSANLRLSTQSFNSKVGQTYLVPSAKDLVEFGSRLGLVSSNGAAVAAWTDTRNSLGHQQQDIFSRRVLFPAR